MRRPMAINGLRQELSVQDYANRYHGIAATPDSLRQVYEDILLLMTNCAHKQSWSDEDRDSLRYLFDVEQLMSGRVNPNKS